MKLGQLFPGAARGHLAEQEITGITSDSRAVEPGNIFVAVSGTKVDGLTFAAEAARKGAIAIIGDGDKPAELPAGLLYMRVNDPRRVLALTASALHPRQPATIVAVTGTAGKTSVADFTRQIFATLGHQAASVGTIGIVTPKGAAYGSLTTPDPVALHTTLDRLAKSGITHLAMEASSHGLDQRRLDGVRLSAAAFTNLGRDHLDYHPTMEDYLKAKLRLFEVLIKPGQPIVVNADGDYSAEVIVSGFARDLGIFSVGREGMDLKLIDSKPDHFAQMLTLEFKGRRFEVRLPLVGEFQAGNAMVAAGLAMVTGNAPEAVIAALGGLKGVRGRLELVGDVHGAPVFVDYAHKPEALAHALAALRPFTTGRLIVVFGCGGDRDTGKRPIMGQIAVKNADIVIVTDDNPRSENPASIRAAILAAAPGAEEIGDRAQAIHDAALRLRPGDCLLIAGKGHETGQIVGGKTLPFSDHTVALEAIAAALEVLPPPSPPVASRPERKVEERATAPAQPPGSAPAKPLPQPRKARKPSAGSALWTGEALQHIPDVRIAGVMPAAISGVSIDTRTLQPGDLFVAIKGDRLDGHDYVERAFEAGATVALIAEDQSARFSGKFADVGALMMVPDPLAALQALGRAARTRMAGRVLAVTGSVGKTSTKEAMLHILSKQGRTHASVASYNNHWGVPLTLARMPQDSDFGIFEIGMSAGGEITPLTKMVRPHVALITAVEAVHLASFSGVEGIADAKAEIFLGLEPGGTAILPRDNPHYERLLRHAREAGAAHIVTFGEHAEADARLVDVALQPGFSSVEALINGKPIIYRLGAPGRHMVLNSLAILAAVEALGADLAQAGLALASFAPAVGRGSRATLKIKTGSFVLLDESYNANPASMKAAFDVLGRAATSGKGRRIAVLGDMLELGPQAEMLHRNLLEPLKSSGIDLVFACGPLMKALFDALPAALQGGYALNSEALEQSVSSQVQPGDVVMVKGSNGSKMGLIVKSLKEAHEPIVEPPPAD
ncbi:MAG: UDP-N-acetylmuramoylalanyl-D-glutamyl-2,6-diaminopimelate--D-alanyl-D-alanine ligase [Beijerinckiaceae bacterium]|nr:UDP-N-acetylmuramoylalanyl-D-glutamyl-2,6-diaminopimelate--D-alanyl-D-alanine ligase [Beijerinckiaceae bacterium]